MNSFSYHLHPGVHLHLFSSNTTLNLLGHFRSIPKNYCEGRLCHDLLTDRLSGCSSSVQPFGTFTLRMWCSSRSLLISTSLWENASKITRAGASGLDSLFLDVQIVHSPLGQWFMLCQMWNASGGTGGEDELSLSYLQREAALERNGQPWML